MAPQRKHTMKKVFRKQPTVNNYVDPFETTQEGPLKSDMSPVPSTRHWSIPNSIKKRFSFTAKKAESSSVPLREDDCMSPKRRDRSITASTFYDDESMAVTKNVSEPADFSPLQLKGKNMNELLMLLRPVSLLQYLLTTTVYTLFVPIV